MDTPTADVFTKQLLSPQTEELQASRHQSAQEARSRRQLDSFRAESLERMRADVEERERRLRALSEQLDRDGRMNELQRQRSSKHIRQVRPTNQQNTSSTLVRARVCTCVNALLRTSGFYWQLSCNHGSPKEQRPCRNSRGCISHDTAGLTL